MSSTSPPVSSSFSFSVAEILQTSSTSISGTPSNPEETRRYGRSMSANATPSPPPSSIAAPESAATSSSSSSGIIDNDCAYSNRAPFPALNADVPSCESLYEDFEDVVYDAVANGCTAAMDGTGGGGIVLGSSTSPTSVMMSPAVSEKGDISTCCGDSDMAVVRSPGRPQRCDGQEPRGEMEALQQWFSRHTVGAAETIQTDGASTPSRRPPPPPSAALMDPVLPFPHFSKDRQSQRASIQAAKAAAVCSIRRSLAETAARAMADEREVRTERREATKSRGKATSRRSKSRSEKRRERLRQEEGDRARPDPQRQPTMTEDADATTDDVEEGDDDRTRIQREQIQRSRQLQSRLRSLQTVQKQEIKTLKKQMKRSTAASSEPGVGNKTNRLNVRKGSSSSSRIDNWKPVRSQSTPRSGHVFYDQPESPVTTLFGSDENRSPLNSNNNNNGSNCGTANDLETESEALFHEAARSSISSPGKLSLRERLQQRILRKQQKDNTPSSLRFLPRKAKKIPSPQSKTNIREEDTTAPHTPHRQQRQPGAKRSSKPITIANALDDIQHSNSPGRNDNHSRNMEDSSCSSSLHRMTRKARYGSRGSPPQTERQTNRVKIHVYDLIASEALLALPWGCDFPIGKCFQVVNNGLHAVGTGAYHVGVEVNGIEYAFGANNSLGVSGVFTCIPRRSPGYEFRTTLDFQDRKTVRKGWINVPDPNFVHYLKERQKNAAAAAKGERSRRELDTQLQTREPDRDRPKIPSVYREIETFLDGACVMEGMAREYMGRDYDLLRKNCCTFAKDACLRLGVLEEEIPSWFWNMAEAGVATEDAVAHLDANVVEPIKRILSGNDCDTGDNNMIFLEKIYDCGMDADGEVELNISCESNSGFEVIALKSQAEGKTGDGGQMDCLRIVESKEAATSCRNDVIARDKLTSWEHENVSIGIRQTLSWAY